MGPTYCRQQGDARQEGQTSDGSKMGRDSCSHVALTPATSRDPEHARRVSESVPDGRTKVSGTLKPQFQTPFFGLLEQTLSAPSGRVAHAPETLLLRRNPFAAGRI